MSLKQGVRNPWRNSERCAARGRKMRSLPLKMEDRDRIFFIVMDLKIGKIFHGRFITKPD